MWTDLIDKDRAKRLFDAVLTSHQRLKHFREKRLEIMRQIAGKHYSDNASPDKVPLNMLRRVMEVFSRQLVARNPRVMITTDNRDLRPYAKTHELEINKTIEKIDLRADIQEVVVEMLMMAGPAKCGLEATGAAVDNGRFFCSSISLDDWVHDVYAKKFNQCSFMGHRLRERKADFENNPEYDETAKLKTKATTPETTNPSGDQRSSTLQGSENGGDRPFDEYVEIWEIYLPNEKIIVKFAAETGAVLCATNWKGYDTPYRLPGFLFLPDNIMPLSLCSNFLDLHDTLNFVRNKLTRQAEGQKQIGLATGQAEDAKRITECADQQTTNVTNPNAVLFPKIGGPDQANIAYVIQTSDEINRMAGNLDLMSGSESSSPTLGQDQLLAAGSSMQLRAMKDEIIEFVEWVVKSMGFYQWDDPMLDMIVEKPVRKTDIKVAVRVTSDSRRGAFIDYNYDVHPYSMQDESPQTKLSSIERYTQGLLLPMLPVLQSQGKTINAEKLLADAARYANIEDTMEDVLMPGPPPMPQQQGQPSAGPPQGERTYSRQSSSAPSQQGKNKALISTLLGAGVSANETTGIGN